MRFVLLLLSTVALGACDTGQKQSAVTVFEVYDRERKVSPSDELLSLRKQITDDRFSPKFLMYKKTYRLYADKVALKIDSGEPMWLSQCVVLDRGNWTCEDPIEGKVGLSNGRWIGKREHLSEWRGVLLECKNLVFYPNDPEISWNKCWSRLSDYIMQ